MKWSVEQISNAEPIPMVLLVLVREVERNGQSSKSRTLNPSQWFFSYSFVIREVERNGQSSKSRTLNPSQWFSYSFVIREVERNSQSEPIPVFPPGVPILGQTWSPSAHPEGEKLLVEGVAGGIMAVGRGVLACWERAHGCTMQRHDVI